MVFWVGWTGEGGGGYRTAGALPMSHSDDDTAEREIVRFACLRSAYKYRSSGSHACARPIAYAMGLALDLLTSGS